MTSIFLFYIGIKAAFLYGLIRSFVVFEPLQKHWFFMAVLYTLGLAFISYIFVVSPGAMSVENWKLWLGKSAGLALVYFFLLRRFDEGPIFWILMMAGLGLVWF